jgi:hypothetical protein
VLGDSINVLSKACISSDNTINCGMQVSRDEDAPVAANTTINSAFLAGTDITSSGKYSGGIENYPRFHENWNSKTLTYRGSFVSLNAPLHVKGLWSSQKYKPPVRVWDYDADFNVYTNLPPLSPRFVDLRQEQFIRTFD